MPVREWICEKCKKTKKTMKSDPECCGLVMKKILSIPRMKMLEPSDPIKGKSKMKDQEEILLRRAKEHSRDVDMDRLIQRNDLNIAEFQGWLSKDKKTKRKKVEDL